MFNDYFEEKPVGFTSIPAQKKAEGITDNSYLEYGKGIVNPDKQQQ
mgnify:CR=1 FL=1